jgi:hypothetical protein
MERWTEQQAHDWYRTQPWLVGCNFIPSTAINQLEMWQAETFDPATITRELGWAGGIGYNIVRVYLHDLAWSVDPGGFKQRIDRFLACGAACGIRPLFVFFDDCWLPHPHSGRQPDPIPGMHNSGWVQSPGKDSVNDPATWPRLEHYVKDVLATFGQDSRVLGWDLYNEPGNCEQGIKSLPLLRQAFQWARESKVNQPLTAAIWKEDSAEINGLLLGASDIVTFHNYNDADNLKRQIRDLKAAGRPLICTEWLRRTDGSVFDTHLPIFKHENVGCCHWGLVSGKTQTIYAWGSKGGEPEPTLWFHDLLRRDGTPFAASEHELIRKLVRRG